MSEHVKEQKKAAAATKEEEKKRKKVCQSLLFADHQLHSKFRIPDDNKTAALHEENKKRITKYDPFFIV